MNDWLKDCTLCPRECHVDRSLGNVGYCGQSAEIKAARAALHFWEEPCISGVNGSGAIFFSGCNLRCVFCQNHTIAQGYQGKTITVARLAEIMLELQDKGAHNINLVTGTPYVPVIIEAIDTARVSGLRLPIVYNTSAYENLDTIRMLEGYVDVYLPDLKYISKERALRYSKAADYFEKASLAIEEMVRQTGRPTFFRGTIADDSSVNVAFVGENAVIENEVNEIMTSGVIIRHLVMPGAVKEAKAVLDYVAALYGDEVYLSIMSQYTPLSKQLRDYPEIDRKLTKREYDRVVDYALELGLNNVFIQEGAVAKESFIPAFDLEGI